MLDHLAAEALLVARLKDQVPEFRAVYTAGELAQVDEATQIVPAAHVIYDGERFEDEAGKGAARKVTQTWLVVVAVESASDPVTGAGARASAGVLMQKAINALAGHKLGEGFRECRRADAPRASYSGPFAYFPLAFEVSFIGG